MKLWTITYGRNDNVHTIQTGRRSLEPSIHSCPKFPMPIFTRKPILGTRQKMQSCKNFNPGKNLKLKYFIPANEYIFLRWIIKKIPKNFFQILMFENRCWFQMSYNCFVMCYVGVSHVLPFSVCSVAFVTFRIRTEWATFYCLNYFLYFGCTKSVTRSEVGMTSQRETFSQPK